MISMRKIPILLVIAAAIAVLAVMLFAAPRCDANAPHGLTLGNMLVEGCR